MSDLVGYSPLHPPSSSLRSLRIEAMLSDIYNKPPYRISSHKASGFVVSREGTRSRRKDKTYNVKDSFHWGFSVERMVLVFCLLSFLGSGMSLSFTYGSESPFGSMGIRFFASCTVKGEGRKMK